MKVRVAPYCEVKFKMSAEKKVGLGSVKRFGARYGRKTKTRYSTIETEQRKLHKCPYCTKIAVKRLALGIWQCRKCDAKFAGKAYSVERVFVSKDSEKGVKEIEIFQTAKEPEMEAAEEQPIEAEEEER